jgi:ubiquitin-protein ligase
MDGYKMGPRLRRLYNDSREVSERFAEHPHIVIQELTGDPPDHYKIEYRIRGLTERGGKIATAERHVAELILTSEYPRCEPMCRMLTPVFHPNISCNVICIADNWTADQSLADVIIRIGEMIAYQNYNTQSPRNGEAANWAKKHADRFPIDDVELSRTRLAAVTTQTNLSTAPPAGAVPANMPAAIELTSEMAAEPRTVAASAVTTDEVSQPSEPLGETKCQNCAALVSTDALFRCSSHHEVCSDCVLACKSCARVLCVLCSFRTCNICGEICCTACARVCSACNKTFCPGHVASPTSGAELVCQRCVNDFRPSGVLACGHCGTVPQDPNGNFCVVCGAAMHQLR